MTLFEVCGGAKAFRYNVAAFTLKVIELLMLIVRFY